MSARDLGVLYAHLLAQVGVKQAHDFGYTSALSFQRFAMAAGDQNPRYFDGDVARAQSFADSPAPPMYLSSVFGWGPGPAPDQLRSDGAGADRHDGMELEGLRLMGAGQELEFFEPLYAGVSVRATSSIDEVQLKQGRSGEFLVITLLWSYHREDGVLLATNRERLIARQAA